MRFARPRRGAFASRSGDEPGVLPLINVVFLLLVFFMVAGRLETAEPMAVTPPRSTSEGRAEASSLLVLIDAAGRIALDGRIVDEAGLRAALAEHEDGGAEPLLRLKADGGAEAARVVAVLELLREAGIERLRLLTLPAARPGGP